MCGIAGIIAADQHEAEAAIARMLPAMIHRGPDDSGTGFFPTTLNDQPATAAFGFRRLAILDLTPAGHQPMVNPETGDCLIFNGEIYNFRVLRRDLEVAGCRLRGTSDTEVLLYALSTWGDDALHRLEGMYTFAFYRAADRSVLIARDPLGIKPLYVSEANGRFIFASEIRTVLASRHVPRTLSVDGITGLLAFGSVQAPHTAFQQIGEFPAGHFQWLGKPRQRHWDFPERTDRAIVEPAMLVRERLTAAVTSHLVADVPVGIFLSAGIDSTIIAGCAKAAGSRAAAFTVGIGARFPDDEAEVAAATAQTLGMRHHVIPIDPADLSELWHRWIDSLDSPSIDGFNTWLVTKTFADQGIKVGLSGLGADELFGGYPVFRTAPRLQRVARALRFLPRDLVGNVATRLLRIAGHPGPAEKLPDILSGDRRLESIVSGLRRITRNAKLHSLGLQPPRCSIERQRDRDLFNVISRAEMTHYMKNTLLRDADANSMSHSLELRVPFLDLPLVEAVTAMPGNAKRATLGPGKRLLREAMRDHVPSSVASRRKTGFRLPIDAWMRHDMREFCESAINSCAAAGVLHADTVRGTWQRYLASRDLIPWAQPFSLIVLGAYMRRMSTS